MAIFWLGGRYGVRMLSCMTRVNNCMSCLASMHHCITLCYSTHLPQPLASLSSNCIFSPSPFSFSMICQGQSLSSLFLELPPLTYHACILQRLCTHHYLKLHTCINLQMGYRGSFKEWTMFVKGPKLMSTLMLHLSQPPLTQLTCHRIC